MNLQTQKIDWTFNRFFGANEMMNKMLDTYAMEQNCVNDSYHVAKCFLAKISEKAFNDVNFREVATNWMVSGGTINLLSILSEVGYNDSNLCQFNAFTLLDTIAE